MQLNDISGPQLKPLANILLRLDKEGVIPIEIARREASGAILVITTTHEYKIARNGHTTRQRY